jgi:NitT/TauT family transport system permease protein
VFASMPWEARSGALFATMGVTLLRVAATFILVMAVGSVIGHAIGHNTLADRLIEPRIVVLLNLLALVIIVLANIWTALIEAAAICVVGPNKPTNATVTIREGVRALDGGLMAAVFAYSPWKRLCHVVPPRLSTFLAATRSGPTLVWKIVLVVELLACPTDSTSKSMPLSRFSTWRCGSPMIYPSRR